MEDFLDKELKSSIKSFKVKTGISKNNTPYTFLSLVLINGYEHKIFIQAAEKFAFTNAFELISTQQQIDSNFM